MAHLGGTTIEECIDALHTRLYLKELVKWLTEHLLKMKSKTIIFRDPVVERVCDKFVKRSDVGYAKYGRTLHDERTGKHKSLAGYLNDVQEELMDAILYIQAAKEEISDNVADQSYS